MGEARDASRRFWGNLILTIGLMIASLCGACTLFFGGAAVVDILRTGGHEREFGSQGILQIALVIGLPPTLIGVALIWWGLRVRRGAAQR